jgi:hypothetical protein
MLASNVNRTCRCPCVAGIADVMELRGYLARHVIGNSKAAQHDHVDTAAAMLRPPRRLCECEHDCD